MIRSFQRAALGVVVTLALAAPAFAQDYILFVYETPDDFSARTDAAKAPAYWGAYAALAQALGAAGVVKGGSPLTAPREGRSISVRQGRTVVSPVDGSREQLSGFFIIEAADQAAAEAWAARVPAAATARVEVRPVLDIPMMPPMK